MQNLIPTKGIDYIDSVHRKNLMGEASYGVKISHLTKVSGPVFEEVKSFGAT